MKARYLVFVLMQCCVFLSVKAQFHMPTNHQEGGSNCYGFAMGNAFSKDNPEFLCYKFNITASGMDSDYFTFVPDANLTNVPLGTVVRFGSGEGLAGHVAVLTNNTPSSKLNWVYKQVRNGTGVYSPSITGQEIFNDIGEYASGYYTFANPGSVSITLVTSEGTGDVRLDVAPDGGKLTKPSGYTFSAHIGSEGQIEAIASQFGKQTMGWRKNGLILSTGATYNLHVQGGGTYVARYPMRHEISSNFTVGLNEGLDISSDDQVDIYSNGKILVYGTLMIEGQAGDSVILSPLPGLTWQGIEFVGSANSSISYAIISRSNTPLKATNSQGLTIQHLAVRQGSWSNAAMQFYSSSPTITNVTIDGQWQGYEENGIRFAQGSTGSITNSTIKNLDLGNGIVLQGGSTPLIQNNTIKDNYYYEIIGASNGVSANVNIKGNTFIDDTYTNYSGVFINASKATLTYNYISGHVGGIITDNASAVYGYDVNAPWWETLSAGNTIVGNQHGLIGYGDSDFYLGEYLWSDDPQQNIYFGGCNQIHSNSVFNVTGSGSGTTFYVKGNWWGTTSPLTTFNVVGPAKIYYSPFQSSSSMDCYPGGSRVLSASDPIVGEPTKQEFDIASATKALRDKGQFDEAADMAYEIVQTTVDMEIRERALSSLFRTILSSQSESLLDLLDPERFTDASIQSRARRLRALIYLEGRDYGKAMADLNDVLASNSKSEDSRLSLLTLASLHGYDNAFLEVSRDAIRRLRVEYSSDETEAYVAALSISEESNPIIQTTIEPDRNDLSLTMNPNPFNPSTFITFQLSERSQVEITVIDLLGRVVKSIALGSLSSGNHQQAWNADGLSSGIYVVKMLAKSESNKVHTASSKAVLMR